MSLSVEWAVLKRCHHEEVDGQKRRFCLCCSFQWKNSRQSFTAYVMLNPTANKAISAISCYFPYTARFPDENAKNLPAGLINGPAEFQTIGSREDGFA